MRVLGRQVEKDMGELFPALGGTICPGLGTYPGMQAGQPYTCTSSKHPANMMVILALMLISLTQGAFAQRNRDCTPYVELKYKYRAVAYNGIPHTSEKVSGVETNMTFLINIFKGSNQMVLEILECSSAPLPNFAQPSETETCKKLKQHPLPFEMVDGHVVGAYPSSEEKEEILNLKRGILSAFQVNPKGKDNTHTVDEVDILGTCQTSIRESHGENGIELLKQRQTGNCQGHPKHTIISQNQAHHKFMHGKMRAFYRLNKHGRILLAELTQEEELAPMTKEAGQIVTHVNQKFWIVHGSDQCKKQIGIDRGRKTTLVFDYNASSDTVIANAETIEKTVSSIIEANAKDIPELFIELIADLRKTTLQELRRVHNRLKDVERKQSMFLDALAFTATNQAVELIVELTHPHSDLSETRKAELALSLTAVPVQYGASCSLLALVLKLAKNRDTCQSSTLALGTVINRVSEYNSLACKSEINESIQYLEDKIRQQVQQLPEDYHLSENAEPGQLHHAAWEQAVGAIKALGNAGALSSISKLEEAMKEKKLLIEGRTAAVYALQRISKKNPLKVREIALQLYMNSANEVEIRIAGFNVFIHTMTLSCDRSYQMIWALHKAAHELNVEVQSYVCSYLAALRHSQDPFYRRLHACIFYYEKWTNVSKTCNATSHSIFSSSAYQWYKPIAEPLSHDAMGVALSFGYISTAASHIPRFMSAKLRASLFGYDMNLMEAGVRMTGIEKQICSTLLGSGGYIRLGSLSEEAYSLLCGNHDENTTLSAYMKAMGDEVIWKNFRLKTTVPARTNTFRDHVAQLFGKAKELPSKFITFVRFLESGKYPIWSTKVNMAKTAGFLDVRRVVPTIIGMPLNLTISAAGHMELDFKTIVDYITDHPYKDAYRWLITMLGDKSDGAFDIRVNVKPKLSVAAKVQLLLDDYQFKPKLVFFANSSTNFSQNIYARVNINHNTDISINEMPESETLLLNASYVQFAEVAGRKQELRLQQQKQKGIYVKAYDLVGLDFLANVSYPNTNGHPTAPLMPISGPANLTVAIRQPNANLRKLHFSFRERCLQWSCLSLNASLKAVGINRSINSALGWKVENKVHVLTGLFSSIPANSSIVGVVNTNSPLTIDGLFNLKTSHAKMAIGIGLNSTNVNANSSLFIAKQRIYEAELSGSHQLFKQGNLSVTLFTRNQKSPHLFIFREHLGKWHANITGDLLLSGNHKPHHVNIGGSFGKHFANFEFLTEIPGHNTPYHMGISGSYHNGYINGSAMVHLPDILKRWDLRLNAAVGKWFTNISAILHEEGKPVPHRMDIQGIVRREIQLKSHSAALTDRTSKWHGHVMGNLVVSGMSKPHHIQINGLLGKYFANLTGLVKVAEHSSPYQIAFNGSYHDGIVSSSAMLHLPDILKRHNLLLRVTVSNSKQFSYISLILHQEGKHVPHKLRLGGSISRESIHMFGFLQVPGNARPYTILWKNKIGKWHLHSALRMHLANQEHPNYLNVSGRFDNGSIVGRMFLNTYGLLMYYDNLPSDSFARFCAMLSNALYQPHRTQDHHMRVVGNIGKWYSNNTVVFVQRARDKHGYYLKFNGSIAKWYINATAFLLDGRHSVPHRVHLSATIGKWFLNGTAFFHNANHIRPYRIDFNSSAGRLWIDGSASYFDKQPHRVHMNGSAGYLWIDGSASYHHADDELPHRIYLKGSVDRQLIKGMASYHHAHHERPYVALVNGSFGPLWIKGSASYHHTTERQPYKIFVNGSVGKFWVNGSASYHHPPDRRPYQVVLNGSVGQLWVNGSASFWMPKNEIPHHASLRGTAGKWFVNVSSALWLRLHNWNKQYLNSSMLLVGRAVKLSVNSSIFELTAVKRFLRVLGQRDNQLAKQDVEVMKTSDSVSFEKDCKSRKTFSFIHWKEKHCRSRIELEVCSSNCRPIYDAPRIGEFYCFGSDAWNEEQLQHISSMNLPYNPVVECQRK